jgi:hypothetical protein
MLSRIVNWYLDHSPFYKRWAAEQERQLRANIYYDTVIGR